MEENQKEELGSFCTYCGYGSQDPNWLKGHMNDRHFRCALCSEVCNKTSDNKLAVCFDCQGIDTWKEKYKELKPKHNDKLNTPDYEKPANKWLADELRKLADHIEHGKDYPRVMDARIPKKGIGYEGIVGKFVVILSHPWGG